MNDEKQIFFIGDSDTKFFRPKILSVNRTYLVPWTLQYN